MAHQAVPGYVDLDEAAGTFSHAPEQATVFAREESPVYLIGAYDTAVSIMQSQDKVQKAFRTGEGVGRGDQSECLFCAVAKFFRPGYEDKIVRNWPPALDGMAERLRTGGRIADMGCGHGFSTLIMARAFPEAEVVGSDFHAPSIAGAEAHAAAHGLDNIRFEVASTRTSLAGTTISSPASTACTTWATRRARRRISAGAFTTAAHG